MSATATLTFLEIRLIYAATTAGSVHYDRDRRVCIAPLWSRRPLLVRSSVSRCEGMGTLASELTVGPA